MKKEGLGASTPAPPTHCFLEKPVLDTQNQAISEKKCMPCINRAEKTAIQSLTKKMFEDAGFTFEQFFNLDSRNEEYAAKLVQESNLLIHSGGHVPTQNHFFDRICLCDLLKNYEGVIIGMSAGSMNCADEVYSQPEEEGEAVNPAYHIRCTTVILAKYPLTEKSFLFNPLNKCLITDYRKSTHPLFHKVGAFSLVQKCLA